MLDYFIDVRQCWIIGRNKFKVTYFVLFFVFGPGLSPSFISDFREFLFNCRWLMLCGNQVVLIFQRSFIKGHIIITDSSKPKGYVFRYVAYVS